MAKITSCSQFTQLLVDQQPVYDKEILKDIRPEDPGNWMGHVTLGEFDPYSGTQHTKDRFNSVFPNTTKTWTQVASGTCLGTPCDKNRHEIGVGASRLVYFLEEQHWKSQLICFDNTFTVTKAQEHWDQIINDILRPTTIWVLSNYMRKRGMMYADNKLVANRNFNYGTNASNFTFNWVVVGDEEIYIDTNINPASVFKLTPQMLQRLVQPLMAMGYNGKNPFKDKYPAMIELVADMETTWELDRLGGQQGVGTVPSITGNWRFTEWDAASKFWKYGFSGQIGNYTVRVDPNNLRFNFVGFVNGNFRYQIVLPYKNVPSSGAGGAMGLKSQWNSDYANAQYCVSYVWHPKGLSFDTLKSESVNSEMPFLNRNFGGKWRFAMHDLGADQNGCVIENIDENKGLWVSSHELATEPLYTEMLVAIFHKREPACVIELNTCNSDPGYPTQTYASANTPCPDEHSGTSPTPVTTTLTFTPVLNSVNHDYEIAPFSILCDGGPVANGQMAGTTTLAALVVQLNTFLPEMGVWAVASATTITVTGSCASVSLPFQN